MRLLVALLMVMQSGARGDWRQGGALGLLELLKQLPGNFLLADPGESRGFVGEADLPKLMALLESPEPCAAVLRFESAHLPEAKSTIGHEAALLVEAFRQGYYPVVAASDLHTVDREALRAWWAEWKHVAAPRGIEPGDISLEADGVYVGDFRLENGWESVVRLPALRHHATRIDFDNLDDFGYLRFGVWKEARITFRLLRADVRAMDPPRRFNTTYVARILRVE